MERRNLDMSEVFSDPASPEKAGSEIGRSTGAFALDKLLDFSSKPEDQTP